MKNIIQSKILNMKKFLLFLTIAAGLIVIACNKTTTLPAYTPTVYFSAASKMHHAKDTVSSKGDTLWLTASGGIRDTSRTYPITASFKTQDSISRITYAVLYYKSLPVTFTNAAPDAITGLYTWTATIGLPVPAVSAKTRFYSTAAFGFANYGSAQMGNVASTDSKTTYAK
jgi:hypothetical protein